MNQETKSQPFQEAITGFLCGNQIVEGEGMTVPLKVAEKIENIEKITTKRLLWGIDSILIGLLVGGASAELIANWSVRYSMVSLHKVLIYLAPLITLLTLLGNLFPRFRPSRRQSFIVALASLIFASATAFFLLILISIVAGIGTGG